MSAVVFNPKKHCVRRSGYLKTPTPHLYEMMIIRVGLGRPATVHCCWCGKKRK